MSEILIIDDDRDYAESLKAMLNAHSYHVMWAPDSVTGMEMLRASTPDLIILDIMMSTMGEGLHLAYRLKSDPKYAHIPILMLTGITQRTGLKFDPQDDAEFLPVEDYMDKSGKTRGAVRSHRAHTEKSRNLIISICRKPTDKKRIALA